MPLNPLRVGLVFSVLVLAGGAATGLATSSDVPTGQCVGEQRVVCFQQLREVQVELDANPDNAAAYAEWERLVTAILEGGTGPVEWTDGSHTTVVWAVP
jgi:hypothetical protein